ncbi:MAG: PKD domain-containing protein [Flavobacteriales bacterium]|nr:PKD domain-containing protein [Flavobacteriales bacterium]
MKKSWISTLITVLVMLFSINSYGQFLDASRPLHIKDYIENEDSDSKAKEFFIKEIRKTQEVSEIDNHDFVHFFVDRYDKIKPMLLNRFKNTKTITYTDAVEYTHKEMIPQLADAYKSFREKNPRTDNHKKEQINRFELFDVVNKGPGDPCTNPDFESGDASFWDLYIGEVDGSQDYSYINVTGTTLGASAQHTIMTGAGTDAIGGFPVVNPDGGAASLMLGDGTGTNYSAASASFTFLVDPGSASFTYSYAIVLNDAGHSSNEQPYFKINMYDQGGNPIQCGDYSVVAGGSSADPDFVSYADGVYMPWRTTFAPLNAYIGQNVTIEFIVGDCAQGGHYGYAYLDASCSPAEILGPDTITCAGYPTMSAPPGAASYLWSPGGETTQSITATAPGTYQVTVTPVTGAACAITLDKEIYEFIDTVNAQFVANPMTICAGESISFTDQSTVTGLGTIVSWEWDFDSDGTVDNTTQNPSFTYNTPGTYTVELTASSQGCDDVTTLQVVVDPIPTANFTAPNVCVGQTTSFTDASSAGVDSWNWDFDNDGIVDNTTQNPSYTFPGVGTYPVNLEVAIAGACPHDTTIDVIVAPNAVANFTAPVVCQGVATNFTDASSVGVDTWGWDFDNDGTIDDVTQNPSYTFPSSGTFPVNLEVSIGGNCSHDTTINVTVNQGSTADFSATTVCLGIATDFTDVSVGGVDTWGWDFDNDGVVDDVTQNPSYTFPSAGTFSVNLQVSVGGNCPDDTTINVTVNQTSTADFSPQDVCFGTPSDFTDLSTGGVDTWGWDFDNDGTIDDVTQNPSYTFPVAGTYPVYLEVSVGGNCSHDTIINVNVNSTSTALFTAPDVCDGATTIFTDASIGGPNQWSWDFDNDGLEDDNIQNPTYSFPGPGTYPVSLQVSVNGLCVHDTVINIDVNANPTAAFTFSDECFGSATNFTDQSNGNGATIDTWNWDFTNNGTVDNTNQNPSNGYSTAGNFTAELLVVTTDGCKDSTTVSIDVDAIPVANFGASQECLGNATTFTDSSTVANSNVTQWSWDFGDASGTSLVQNPNYTYANSGTFNVSLTATSDSGCINTIIIPVTVSDNPVANFSTDTACNTYASNFTDLTIATVGIETWNWDFGNDGSVEDNNQNPNYIFAGAGTYAVNLAVVDSFGCSHDTTMNITVSENPIAAFTFSDECYGSATTFTDLSNDNGGTTTINSWEWDFDNDGVVDNITQNPTNLYSSEGNYTVELTVTSILGCTDSISMTVDVDAVPVAHFGIENVCLNTEGTFTDSSSTTIGNINQWTWDFGDSSPINNTQSPSYTYTNPGIYNVTLTVVTDSGCTNNQTIPVEVFPNPTADFDTTDVCLNIAAQFTDQSNGNGGTINQWQWDFEDNGSVDDVTQNPSHMYPTDGTYNIELIVTTVSGCSDTLVKSVTIYPMPTANFNFVSSCFMDSVIFTDNSNVTSGSIDTWDWDFGNGQSSNSQNTSEVYASEGVYNVELIVTTNNGCSDTVTQSGIEVWPLPIVDFIPTNVCLNTATQFEDLSTVSNNFTTNSNVQWQWNMGDGTTGGVQNPMHTYTTEGIYNATLVVTTNNGCVDSITKPVTVHPNPVVNFTGDTLAGCTPVCVDFSDMTILTMDNIASWSWDFNGDGLPDSQGPNPSYCFSNPSNSSVRDFDVSLTVTSDFGCTSSHTELDYVHSYPIPRASFTFSPEQEETTIVNNELSFVDQSVIASSWSWDLGDGTTTTMPNPVHEYADTGHYWVTLNIENVYGCKDSTAKLIRINPIYAIWIPNAFTPDGDGTNEFFYVNGYGIRELQIMIFDRWGLKIYDGIGIDQTWDGYYKGELVPTDVYVYKIRAKDVFDEWHDYIGKVTVIK